MKVIQIHNRYRIYGGEDAVVKLLTGLLESRGVGVSTFIRNSRDLQDSMSGRLRTFAGGIYSRTMYRTMLHMIKENQPDIAHIHNIYPIITPSILKACRRVSLPVVMTCHNYRLVCPIGTHFRNGVVCERCIGGKEYMCVIGNCRGNLAESAYYALRSWVARVSHIFSANVTMFIALTEFFRRRLIEAGFAAERIVVLPNMITVPNQRANPSTGTYVAYVGRISPEKGIKTLMDASRQLPQVDVRLAGNWSQMSDIAKSPSRNIELLGELGTPSLSQFYRGARYLVLPSLCFEGFPMVLLEAMSYGLPIVASRIGGIPEVVEEGVTGLLFEPGKAEDLADKMKLLWENPDLCRMMGEAARKRVLRDYNMDGYFEKLMSVYTRSIEINQMSA